MSFYFGCYKDQTLVSFVVLETIVISIKIGTGLDFALLLFPGIVHVWHRCCNTNFILTDLFASCISCPSVYFLWPKSIAATWNDSNIFHCIYWINFTWHFFYRFTKNLSPDKISLSAMKGEGDLSNLELDEVVLTDLLALPGWIRLRKATCNKVTIKVYSG